MTISQSTISPDVTQTAKALRALYFTRAVFSVVWVTLIATFAKTSPSITAILLVIYPAWDVLGTILDLRANRGAASKSPQYLNITISAVTTIAVGAALTKGVPATLIVFGAWAILTGAIQFVLGLRRRHELGGQWPMILSGCQSLLGGSSFIALAHSPTMGVTSLAGYSAFGAFYYLLAALRLNKSVRDK